MVHGETRLVTQDDEVVEELECRTRLRCMDSCGEPAHSHELLPMIGPITEGAVTECDGESVYAIAMEDGKVTRAFGGDGTLLSNVSKMINKA